MFGITLESIFSKRANITQVELLGILIVPWLERLGEEWVYHIIIKTLYETIERESERQSHQKDYND